MALLAGMRPRQWSKNAFVFAALLLTKQLDRPGQLAATAVTFALFCAISSAVYLLNDLVDIESDRTHPEKRRRPLASGELGPGIAWLASGALAAGGVVGALLLVLARPCGPGSGLADGRSCTSPLLLVAVIGYLGLQLAYSLALKHVVIVEVLAIAGGFVLRVLAGGAAIDTRISPYLYLSMIFLALFQGFAKRQHELRVLADAAADHRPSLEEYSARLLDTYIVIAATSTIVTYSLYAITTPDRPPGVSENMLLITVPFVIYAILRYLYLVQVRGVGGAPEDILLRDRPLLVDVIAWVLVLTFILYGVPYWSAP